MQTDLLFDTSPVAYRLPFVRSLALLLVLAFAGVMGSACESSSKNVIGPTGTRCALTLTPNPATIGADGGSGTVTVAAARECVWSAKSASDWITVTAGENGQGDGTINYTASRNTVPAMRHGAITVSDQRTEISQSAAACTLNIDPRGATMPSEGGDGAFRIDTLEGCQWNAVSDVPWLVLRGSSSGSGPAALDFHVDSNGGAPRVGTVHLGSTAFTLQQNGIGNTCSYAIALASSSIGAGGGNLSVDVAAGDGCAWMASSNVSWITVIGGASGTGNGSVTLAVAANDGTPRTGTVVIAGQIFTVTQGVASGCSYSLSSTEASTTSGGGLQTLDVSAPGGCEWTAASNVPWISVTSGSRGNGTGTVVLAVATNTGSQRTGTVTVAGMTYTLTQGAAATSCSYSISPIGQSVGSGGGQGTIMVSAPAGCAWTAVSHVSWITVTNGSARVGSGSTTLSIASNAGVQRVGTVTVAGKTYTVTQSGAATTCSYSISPTAQSLSAVGGVVNVSVTTASGCAWTASSQASWVVVVNGSSGSGNGSVQLSVAPNPGAARSGTVLIGGRSFAVSQAALVGPPPCSYGIDPQSQTAAAVGGSASIAVATADGCTWTATSAASWISIASGSSGTGSGTVTLAIAPNTGDQRDGTVTVAGQTHTVTQSAAACSYKLTPTSQQVSLLGGSFSVDVQTDSRCSWTASTDADWIDITGDATGNGNGTITYRVGLTLLSSRTGRITIGEATLVVRQSGVLETDR